MVRTVPAGKLGLAARFTGVKSKRSDSLQQFLKWHMLHVLILFVINNISQINHHELLFFVRSVCLMFAKYPFLTVIYFAIISQSKLCP